MPCLDDHADALWADASLNGLRDLVRQPLLNLQPPRVHVHQPRHFAQADHLFRRNVRDMASAEERKQVMLAQAIHFDVLDDHHFVIAHAEHRTIQKFLRVLSVTAGEKTQSLVKTLGSPAQSFAIGILTEQDDDAPNQIGNAFRFRTRKRNSFGIGSFAHISSAPSLQTPQPSALSKNWKAPRIQNCSFPFPRYARVRFSPTGIPPVAEKSRGTHSPWSARIHETRGLARSCTRDRTHPGLSPARIYPSPRDSRSCPSRDRLVRSHPPLTRNCGRGCMDSHICQRCARSARCSIPSETGDAKPERNSAATARASLPFPRAIHKQIRRFIQTNTVQTPLMNFRLENPPQHGRDFLARRNLPRQLGDFVIQMAMVHPLCHFTFENFL